MAEVSGQGAPQQYRPPDSFYFRKCPKNVVYRACQASWYKMWPWLSYDQTSDKVYCHICQKAIYNGRVEKARGDPAFVSRILKIR